MLHRNIGKPSLMRRVQSCYALIAHLDVINLIDYLLVSEMHPKFFNFQMDVAEIIDGIEGAANAQDDIIVWGDTKEVHDQRLYEVLSRIKDFGLKLNRKKCQFCVAQITFLGHVLSGDGVYAEPRKISAIIDMPVPQNRTELQRFLGMCNYLGKFMPDLASVTSPLPAYWKRILHGILSLRKKMQ